MILSLLATKISNYNYTYTLFFNHEINITMVIDVLVVYFSKYNIIMVVFLLWLHKFRNIEILYITRSKNIFHYVIKSIFKYLKYIFLYYAVYLIIISCIFIDQFKFSYSSTFIITSCSNALILFLILAMLELIAIHNSNNYIFYIIALFTLIANSGDIYRNKYLKFFYELVNNSKHSDITWVYYLKSLVIIALLIFSLKILLKKIDLY